MRRFVVAALVAPFLVLPAASSASAACARVASDFNGDGLGDLAVSAPNAYEPVEQVNRQGMLHIAYGSAAGMGKGSTRSFTFTGRTSGLPNSQFTGSSRLGQALASGYFDGDCYADLAVSAASSSIFLILYGSSIGLTTTRSAALDRTSIQPDGAYGSGLSYDLASGDFNGDGFDDVAAGAPWEKNNSGAFGVLYGSAAGIISAGSRWVTQDSPDVPGGAEGGDVFGQSLAAGDFNGDGKDDLAVGSPGEAIGTQYDAGGVIVFSGTAAGLATAGSKWWDQNSPNVPGGAESLDTFGGVLTAGDTDGDHRDELVVAAAGESIGAKYAAGMVHLFRGTASGLVAGSAFDQDNAQIPGDAENTDYFGSALALVDMNRDGRRDLVVGVGNEGAGAKQSTGAINILYSTATGPSAAGSVYVDQNSAGVPDSNEEMDSFGQTLSRLEHAYGGDALVVGATDEKLTLVSEGAVTILPSAPRGTARPAGSFFTGTNFPGGASKDSNFGAGLP